jgi:uncharacterized protein YjbI with pentapeptide repeats
MWARGEKQPRTFKPMTWWMIAGPILLGLMVTVAAMIFLLNVADVATSPNDRAQLRIDAIRTALAVGVGAGGVTVLILNMRRQLVNEYEHQLQTKTAEETRYDAAERRVTELYTKAVDQLASDSAAVRVGALYALERLAQANPEHRQTIVDLICGYLRLRKEVPISQANVRRGDADDAEQPRIHGLEESEVRATAQEILRAHLSFPRHGPTYSNRPQREPWPDMRLDLHGAKLENFALDHAQVFHVDFRGTKFWGTADFTSANIEERSYFDGAIFNNSAQFGGATFAGYAYFTKTQFCGTTSFERANFPEGASFNESVFKGSLSLARIRASDVEFYSSEFLDAVYVNSAKLANSIVFDDSTFRDYVLLVGIDAPDDMVRLNRATIYGFVDFGDRPELFQLNRTRAPKSVAEKTFPPDGWFLHEDEQEEFAIFESERLVLWNALKAERDGKSIKPAVVELRQRRYLELMEDLAKLADVGGHVTVGEGVLELYSPNGIDEGRLLDYRDRADSLGYQLAIVQEPKQPGSGK